MAAGRATQAGEDGSMRLLMKAATVRLGAAVRARLEGIEDAAIRSGLKPETAKPRPCGSASPTTTEAAPAVR